MATVLRGHDERLDRDVALKLFAPVVDADELTRPQAEARILGAFEHPHLVRLLDVGVEPAPDGTLQMYLVLELVEGRDLAARIAAGPLGSRLTARLGEQVAQALAAVHDAAVAHRDLKPGNILLAGPPDAPDAKVADFGIARIVDGTRMTMTGTTLGTVSYLSPEQAGGDPVGTASDVYSLGLVLLECLTGSKAFQGTPAEVAAARLTAPPPVPESVSAPWRALLGAMTALDPQDRPTAAQVAEVLAGWADESDEPVTVPLGLAAVPLGLAAPRRGWRGALRRGGAGRGVALAVAALALGVAGVAWAVGTPDEPVTTVAPAGPAVGGTLGAALDELAASVQP
jgi:serine/threonine protein kinase